MNELGNRQIEMLDADELTANPWNPNSVGAENMTKIKASLQNNGFFKPVLYRVLEDGTKEIIGGEHRIIAAGELGMKVPALSLGTISDSLAKKFTLMDNDSYGENDTARLSKVLQDLEDAGEAITEEMTYTEEALSEMLNLTVDSEMDMLDSLDDLNLDEPEHEDRDDTDSEHEPTTMKTLKTKIDIADAEYFEDLVREMADKFNIEDSDPAVVRGLVFRAAMEQVNDSE